MRTASVTCLPLLTLAVKLNLKSDAQRGQTRGAGRPLNRERRRDDDPTERLATARTAAVLHPLKSATDQEAYTWLLHEAQRRDSWRTLVDRVACLAALRFN